MVRGTPRQKGGGSKGGELKRAWKLAGVLTSILLQRAGYGKHALDFVRLSRTIDWATHLHHQASYG